MTCEMEFELTIARVSSFGCFTKVPLPEHCVEHRRGKSEYSAKRPHRPASGLRDDGRWERGRGTGYGG